MKNFASLAGLMLGIVLTDYLITKVDGSRLDRYPLKKKNKSKEEPQSC